MRKTRMTPLGANTFMVRVDGYEKGAMSGAFTGPMVEYPVEFKSMTGMILMLDELLDEQGENDSAPIRPSGQNFATSFELEVLFRQNQSWQGRIRFLDQAREATFRSVLELMILLETVYGQ